MSYTNPILEEKYRVQERLSEEASDMRDYSRRAHAYAIQCFEERGWKPNYQPCEIRKPLEQSVT